MGALRYQSKLRSGNALFHYTVKTLDPRKKKTEYESANIRDDASFSEKSHDNLSQSSQIVHPFNQPAFFVQGRNGIGLDVYESYNLVLNDVWEEYLHMRRFVDSTSFFKNLLIMLLNSIRR